MDQNLVQSKQRGPLGKDIWQILKRLARGENIVIYLSTDMCPRLLKKRRGERKGETGTFLFIHSTRSGRLRPHLPRATSWPRCRCPPFRGPDTRLRGDCRAPAARPACATHPAHLLPCLFGDGNGATRGSLEAVHAGRVIPDPLVRRAKTGTSGGAGTASSSL